MICATLIYRLLFLSGCFSRRARFWPLCSVFGTGLVSLGYARGIKSPSDDMVSYAGEVFYPSAPDQYDAMLLKIVANPGNICRYFDTV